MLHYTQCSSTVFHISYPFICIRLHEPLFQHNFKRHLTSIGFDIPVIANGNVITWSDVMDNLHMTRADGIMSAEGLLVSSWVDVEVLRSRLISHLVSHLMSHISCLSSLEFTIQEC